MLEEPRVVASTPRAAKPSEPSISTFSLPPRHVPLGLRLHVLFGGPMQQFGWLFFGFGLIFVWLFALNADVGALVRFLIPYATAEGRVLEVAETGASEGGSDDEPGNPIFAVTYRFVAPNASTYTGTSFTTGHRFQPGARVLVEFPLDRPQESRLQGARRALFGPAALISLIFPAIGLVFVSLGLWDGVKANQLLQGGRLARAQLRSKEGTGATVNNRPVVKLAFEFVAHDGTPHAVEIRTSLPESLEDESEETVLYDPSDADFAILLDGLPGPPRMTSAGELEGVPFLRVAWVSLLPFLTIVGHGLYVFTRFLR